MSHDGSSPAVRRSWFRRALIATAVLVVVVGSYSAAYAVIRWREVVTLWTPYELAIGYSGGHPWGPIAYRFFQPAYAIEVRVRAWRMERWWRPLVESGIANDAEVAGRETLARYWFRRGFLDGMTSDPRGWPGPLLVDPEGATQIGFNRGRFAIDHYLERRLAATGSHAKVSWQSIPPQNEETHLVLSDAEAADHAIVTASLNELRAKLRAEGFTGLVDNR